MSGHEVLTIILSIGIPMLAGYGWILTKMFKIQKELSLMHIEILKEIRGLDSRIAHIEGYLIGYNQKTGTENGKEKK